MGRCRPAPPHGSSRAQYRMVGGITGLAISQAAQGARGRKFGMNRAPMAFLFLRRRSGRRILHVFALGVPNGWRLLRLTDLGSEPIRRGPYSSGTGGVFKDGPCFFPGGSACSLTCKSGRDAWAAVRRCRTPTQWMSLGRSQPGTSVPGPGWLGGTAWCTCEGQAWRIGPRNARTGLASVNGSGNSRWVEVNMRV